MDPTTSTIRIYADRAASKGEQLLEDYGDNRDKIYLQYHGFVSPENPFRCVEIVLPSMHNETALPQGTRELLKQLRFKNTPTNCLEGHGRPDMSLLVYLSVLSMSSQEIDKCSQVVQRSIADAQQWTSVATGCGFAVLSKELENAINTSPTEIAAIPEETTPEAVAGKPFHSLIQQIRRRLSYTLASYPTTLEEDEMILADWSGGAIGTDGHALHAQEEEHNLAALQYRIFMKRHLMKLLQLYRHVPANNSKVNSAQPAHFNQTEIIPANIPSSGDLPALQSEETINVSISSKMTTAQSMSLELREGEMPINTRAVEAELTLEQQLQRFNQWFADAQPSINKLTAQFIPGWRIGTIASADIKDKEPYLGVPKSVIMDSEAARKHTKLSDLFRRITEVYGHDAEDDFHELMFLLIYEMHVEGKNSFYWPYLSLLPTPEDQVIVPTLWSHEQMMERLAPSHIIHNLIEYQSRQQKTYEAVTTVLPVSAYFSELDQIRSQIEDENIKLLSWSNYQWAQAILDSRSIWWAGKRHLVPMLDFINCVEGPDPSRVHSTHMDASNKHAITAASWAFATGEQVFENYGQANYIYFMYHGFALPIGQNTHDCAHHQIVLSEQEQKAIDMKDILAQNIAKQVGFHRQASVGVCLSVEGEPAEKNRRTGLPQDLWLALSLKQNNYKQLREQKLLGQPNVPALTLLRLQLEARLQSYATHFAKGDPHKSSTFFLRTEEYHLQQVMEWIQRELEVREIGNMQTMEKHAEL